jgi:hypothetical protein
MTFDNIFIWLMIGLCLFIGIIILLIIIEQNKGRTK